MPSLLSILSASAFVALSLAANCQNVEGVANGECVKLFPSGDGSCGGNPATSFKPDCTGACFSFSSFDSIHVGGDGTFGTQCIVYSDPNCQTQTGVSNAFEVECVFADGLRKLISTSLGPGSA